MKKSLITLIIIGFCLLSYSNDTGKKTSKKPKWLKGDEKAVIIIDQFKIKKNKNFSTNHDFYLKTRLISRRGVITKTSSKNKKTKTTYIECFEMTDKGKTPSNNYSMLINLSKNTITFNSYLKSKKTNLAYQFSSKNTKNTKNNTYTKIFNVVKKGRYITGEFEAVLQGQKKPPQAGHYQVYCYIKGRFEGFFRTPIFQGIPHGTEAEEEIVGKDNIKVKE